MSKIILIILKDCVISYFFLFIFEEGERNIKFKKFLPISSYCFFNQIPLSDVLQSNELEVRRVSKVSAIYKTHEKFNNVIYNYVYL